MRNLTVILCLTLAVHFGSAMVSFALPPCPSDQNQYYDNCFGTYTFASGDKYVGEYRNGKYHRQGIGNNFSNIQIDAALQPGNSGGPILNDKGNVVGIAVARLDKNYALRNFWVITRKHQLRYQDECGGKHSGEQQRLFPPS